MAMAHLMNQAVKQAIQEQKDNTIKKASTKS